MFRLGLFVALILSQLATNAQAQVVSPSAQGVSRLPDEGVIRQAYVIAVLVQTQSEIGSYTAFLIRVGSLDGPEEWFYIRNDDVTKSLERGAMVGLLMGAVQANRWVEDGLARFVNIAYVTTSGRRMITAASLATSIP